MTLAVRELTHRYGTMTSLRDVTAGVRPGAITAIVGPNAAGKSTLLRCLIGAARPARGAALLDGVPVHKLGAHRLARRVAYVSQRPQVSAAFTVREIVELGRFALPRQPVRVQRAIERMELEELADRPYPALSVGQQQRVMMARALAQLEPDGHLVLDEPTSAMDLQHVHACMRVLRELAAGGVSVLVAMHDLSLAAGVADDAWLLDQGLLEAAGPAGEVLTPERLQRVFRTGFAVLAHPSGGSLLVPDVLGSED